MALFERLQGLGGFAPRQEQATLEELADRRWRREPADPLLCFIEISGADQQVDVGCDERIRRFLHARKPLTEGVAGLARFVALLVVLRQRQPGLVIVHAIAGRREQELFRLFAAPRRHQLGDQGLDEDEPSGLLFVGTPQDLSRTRVIRTLREEVDRREHHHLVRGEAFQTLLPALLRRRYLALLLGEGRGRRADALGPAAIARQILAGRPNHVERLLRLVGSTQTQQRQQLGHEGLRVAWLQFQQARGVLERLFVLLRRHSGFEQQAQRLQAIRIQLQDLDRLPSGVVRAATAQQGQSEQEPVLDGALRVFGGLAQRPDGELGLLGAQQRHSVQVIELWMVRSFAQQFAQRPQRGLEFAGSVLAADLCEPVLEIPSTGEDGAPDPQHHDEPGA